MKNKKLSIIIITKNEETKIDACLREVDKINFIDKEIILVDSNSTDRTIEIAKKHPINIINLTESNIYSPSAGRKVGLSYARGDYILFLDGDQIINRSWLKKYLDLINKDYFDLADGNYIHVMPGERGRKFKRILKLRPVGEFGTRVHGTFLVRNSEILNRENFDPFMRGEEERDFAYRLIKKGYKIFRSKEEIAKHFLKERDYLETKEHIRYMIGIGQIIKKHLFSKFYKEILSDFRMFFIILAIISLICILIFTHNGYLVFPLVLSFFIIFLVRHKFRIRELFSIFLINNLIMPIKVIQGIFVQIFKRKRFKYKIKIIKLH